MTVVGSLYGSSLALLTDLYQLTMAYGYWKSGVAEKRAAFHVFFRSNPFEGGYTVTCGLESAVEYLRTLSFTRSDVDYLAELRGNDGEPLFEDGFLDHLAAMRFTCDVDAMPEGTVAFPHEPLVRVVGPVLQCQIIETPLLNTINFQTLIATKAARVCYAARGEPILEFGLRRAQGMDGGVSATRATYVGGCAGTSNVLAGKLCGIPVKGTHAHSWIMFFEDELEAFDRYAEAMPNNCIFLVDTYDSLEGVKRAIQIGEKLRERGHEMVGVRLDSGDLAHLSIEARKILDEAGFPDATIVASNNLDEHLIASLKEQGATIAVWGVGTKLVTAYDQPALGGVYKLAAVEEEGGWQRRLKLSEQQIKISNPGIHQVRRFSDEDGNFLADMIYDIHLGSPDGDTMVDLMDLSWKHKLPPAASHEDLLVPVFRGGELVSQEYGVQEARTRCAEHLDRLSVRMKRFANPHLYKVGLEPELARVKQKLIDRAREGEV